jgi:hypothetical protein
MSKRRKEGETEEDKPFKVPKFDEAAFFKKEKRNIKTSFISFLFGCFMAVICFGFWVLIGKNGLRWELVLLVAVINSVFIRYIFVKLKIDLDDFGRKNWFSSFAIYFFTWLIVLIVLVNPPFYDDENPLIDMVVIPEMQEPGGDVMILAKITDNSGMDKDKIRFELTLPDGDMTMPDFSYANNLFNYTFIGPSNITGEETYNYTLEVEDSSGHKSIRKGSFTYSNDTIRLALPSSGDTVRAANDIKFYVGADVNRVFYTINGKEINATKSDRYYVTNPEFKGWIAGEENATINVYAEKIYYFENYREEGEYVNFVNKITDTESYYFIVADESTIGQEDSPEISLPGPRYTATPGFEAILFVISLIAVVLILKYRKNNKKNKK